MNKLKTLSFTLSFFVSSFALAGELFNSLSGKYSEVPGSAKVYVNVREFSSAFEILAKVRIDKSFEDYGYETEEISDAQIFESVRFGRQEILVSHNIFPVLPIIPAFDYGPYASPALDSIDEDNFVALFHQKKKVLPYLSIHSAGNQINDFSFSSLSDSVAWVSEDSSCVAYKSGTGQRILYVKNQMNVEDVRSTERIFFFFSSRFDRTENCFGKLLSELKLKLLRGVYRPELRGENILEDALIAATLSQFKKLHSRGIEVLDLLNSSERMTAKYLEIERVVNLQKQER